MGGVWSETHANFRKLEANAITSALADVSLHERQQYSIRKVILNLAGERVDIGLEREISQAIQNVTGKISNGLYVPTRWAIRASGLDTKTLGAGGALVQTSAQDLIELLRNRAMVTRLGATLLTGLRDNLAFPVRLTGSSGSWVGENPASDQSESDSVFGLKNMTPKTRMATTSFTRQFLLQASADVETLVRNDLIEDHALAIDAAAINGSGLANQPLGLLKTTGIGSVAIGTDGGVPTYATVVDMETAVANANADVPAMKFLTTPGIRGKLRKTQQFDSTNGSAVWQAMAGRPGIGDVSGYEGYVSNQVPSTLVKGSSGAVCHAIIFGSWPALIIAEWGVLEIIVDPYTVKKRGIIEVTSFQFVDVLLRQPAQFVAVQDAKVA